MKKGSFSYLCRLVRAWWRWRPFRKQIKFGLVLRLVFSTLLANLKNALAPKKDVGCGFCGWQGEKFFPTLDVSNQRLRLGVKCPRCGSLDRQRLLLEVLKRETDLFLRSKSSKILDLGTTEPLKNLCLKRGLEYADIDLYRDDAQYRIDAENLKFPDGTFDFIIAAHILDHLADDAACLKEIKRVLKAGGTAILQHEVHHDRPKTRESPSSVHYHWGHVREYGEDFEEKVSKLGFGVSISGILQNSSLQDKKKYGLLPPNQPDRKYSNVFILRKTTPPENPPPAAPAGSGSAG